VSCLNKKELNKKRTESDICSLTVANLCVFLYTVDVQALKEIQGLSDDLPDTNRRDILL